MIGRVVKICGLVSKPELNGTLGHVISFVESSGRYNVRLLSDRSGTMPSLKAENIEVVTPGVLQLLPRGWIITKP